MFGPGTVLAGANAARSAATSASVSPAADGGGAANGESSADTANGDAAATVDASNGDGSFDGTANGDGAGGPDAVVEAAAADAAAPTGRPFGGVGARKPPSGVVADFANGTGGGGRTEPVGVRVRGSGNAVFGSGDPDDGVSSDAAGAETATGVGADFATGLVSRSTFGVGHVAMSF